MLKYKLAIGVSTIALTAGGGAVALAAGGSAPNHVNIVAVQSMQVKINRYVQDGMRWQRDVYKVKSGGTITIVNGAPAEGPHTFSVVARKDLPRTARQINNCQICGTIANEHGADPQSQAPPKYMFVENGQGTNSPPNIDRPGDSAFIPPTKNAKVTLKVTAKPGTKLYFMCAVHPWMQAQLDVVR